MSSLRHTSATPLELPALLDWIAGYATSGLGKDRVRSLEPSASREWLERQHQLVAEVRSYLRAGGRFDFEPLSDITTLAEKSGVAGAVLEISEIREVLAVLDLAGAWRAVADDPPASVRSNWSSIADMSSRVANFGDLRKSLGHRIAPDGTLEDNASPGLARIRREIDRQRRSIEQSLRGYLRRLADEGSAQDELITIRGERFVIPVKAEQKRRVAGVVHGASSSGQTVFVEPLETIEQNNELVRLFDEELAEIHRILLEMTRQIGERGPEIVAALETLAELDLQFAKARFAEDFDCCPVKFTERDFILQKARHPLLARNLRARGRGPIPMSLELEGDRRELIITGPNTGGKTVTLKTIGLLALMAQSGIPVTADRAELPIFESVLADIGDSQSIELNLSTFSSHITNIDFISRTAEPSSLVLLDELGSATDPEEGAALAVAIAEHFHSIGCATVISTHHTSLKVYGANTSGVVNASVGFDDKTLEPTYELKVGLPGASAGINIAQRLGLNAAIIASARSRIGSQTQDIATFLDKLHDQLSASNAERQQLAERERELAREKAHLAAEGKKEQQAKTREMEKKLEVLFRDFEYHAREAVQAVQDRVASQKLAKDAERRIAKLRREFREQFDSTVVAHATGADRGDPNAQPSIVRHVSQGDTVRVKSLGRNGRVVRKIDDNQFEIEIGAMKMKIARADIAEVLPTAPLPGLTPVQAARARGITISLAGEGRQSPSEVNVIGQNVDEATREVERFVDQAFLAGLPRVRVVHGSGMGILRKALRQYLQKHPHVEEVKEADQSEGGGGATVVQLKT